MLDFLSSTEHARLAALGTSCPDHFLRTKVRPMVLDLPPDAPLDEVIARLRVLHAAYRADYQAYYERYATPDSPPMRGADPAIVLVPGVGMFSYGADKQTARVAGEFYLNAVNVMRGAEAIDCYGILEIERNQRGGAATGADLIVEFLEAADGASDRHDMGTAPGQRQCRRPADADQRAGDQHNRMLHSDSFGSAPSSAVVGTGFAGHPIIGQRDRSRRLSEDELSQEV